VNDIPELGISFSIPLTEYYTDLSSTLILEPDSCFFSGVFTTTAKANALKGREGGGQRNDFAAGSGVG